MKYYEELTSVASTETTPESHSSKKSPIDPDSPLHAKNAMSWWHYAIVTIMLTLYYVAVVASQVAGIKTNIFQVNSIRFMLQCFGVAPLALSRKASLRIDTKDVYLIVLAMASNVTYASCFFSATSFMPVGNLDGLFVAFYILSSTAVDIFKKSITRRAVAISTITIIGILFVAQPWNSQDEGHLTNTLFPCDYLDAGCKFNTTANCFPHKDLQLNSNKSSWTKDQRSYGTEQSMLFGYAFIVLSAVVSTSSGNVVKCLVVQYPIPVVMFWVTLVEGFLSFIVNLIWTGAVQNLSHYTFPSGGYCIFFLWIFILSIALANSLSYTSYRYLPVSTIAVANALVTVLLYISQRTYLSAFHPGQANVIELLGIVIVISTSTLLPVGLLLLDRIREDKQKGEVN